MENLTNAYTDMVHSNIKFIYKGGITFDVVDSFLTILLKRLDEIESDVNIKKRVLNVLLECAQNLSIHKEPADHQITYDTSSVYFSIEKISETYKISTGNFIRNSKIEQLKKVLDEVNERSTPESLKELYNKILTNRHFSDKGGGGLGLIDIARKSSGQLRYSFSKIDENYSFYVLNVSVK